MSRHATDGRNGDRRTIAIIVAAGLGLAGCGAAEVEDAAAPAATAGASEVDLPDQRPSRTAHHDAVTAHAEGCPMQVEGVTLETETIPGGAALVFTTTEPGAVPELRAMVRAMAPAGDAPPGTAEGLLFEPRADVVAVEIPTGARLELRAEEPGDVDALRRQARLRADMMIRGACPLIPPQQA